MSISKYRDLPSMVRGANLDLACIDALSFRLQLIWLNRCPSHFFSRGRGRGHVYPDIEIGRELGRGDGEVKISFVSYATGAETFRASHHEVIDLQLPENNDYVETLVRASRVIGELRPDLIISHEEFAVLPAARIAGVASIFLGAWLPPLNSIFASSLEAGSAILILEQPGIFPISDKLRSRTRYLGPVVRPLAYTRLDRQKLRRQYGIGEDHLVISVMPGGWASEERVPIASVVLAAFKLIEGPKVLHWVTHHDHARLQRAAAEMDGVVVHRYHPCIEELYAISDLVVTKGTYGITMEAASLGVPTVSLSIGANPIDEILVPRIKSNRSFHAASVTPAVLATCFGEIRAMPSRALNLHQRGCAPVADAITEIADQLCLRPSQAKRDPC